MRYALIILALFFCTIKTEAQVYQAMPQAGYGPVKRMLVDSVLTIPIGISQLRNITGGRDTAQIRYQKSDSSVYVYTGSSWVKLGSGGGGGGGSADSTVFFTVYRADTMRANIYASIVSTDSSVYFTKYRSDTMRANLYSYIKNADSLTYFTKYRSDTMRANIYAAIPQSDTFYVKYPVRVNNDTIYLAQSFVDSVGTGGGGGGGAGTINYYLNGSISQGTFGGTTYYQLSQNPIFGAGTNFTRTNGEGNGYIASFITDANDPNVLGIPGGNWNLEFYFNANSSGGSPQFYAEVYKYDGSTFTLIASGSTNPETITNGTTVDQYFTSIPVPTATLLATDRIAVRVYVITGGRNITLHTENSNLSEVLTTLTIPAWKTNGNSDVNAGRFLGSTNNASVRFRTNNVERMVLDSIGSLSIGNGTIAAASTSILDLTSTSKGLLIPRLTSSQRNAISTPASQLIVANTTDKTVDMYNGTSWNAIGGGYNNELEAIQLMGSTIKTTPIGQPLLPVTGSAMTSGRSFFSAIHLNREATITGASWYQSTQGVYVGTGGGYNGIGLYRDSLGTLLLVDSTTRDTTIWKATTNTWNQKAFAGGTRTLQPGVYYLCALVNTVSGAFPAGQTAPSIGNWSGPSGNSGTLTLLSNSRKIYGGVQTGVTSLPTSQAMTAWNNLTNFYYSLYLY